MLTDPNFTARLMFGFLFWLIIFLVFAKIISKLRKKPINGAKTYLWCLGVFFLVAVILFIRGIILGFWSEYVQGQIIGMMIFGFGVPALVANYLNKRFIKKQLENESS